MTLLQKFAAGIVAGSVAIGAVFCVALYGIHGLDREFDKLSERTLPVMGALVDLRYSVLRSLSTTEEAMLRIEAERQGGDRNTRTLIENLRSSRLRQAMERRSLLHAYQNLVSRLFPEEVEAMQLITQYVADFERDSESIATRLASGAASVSLIDALKVSSGGFLAAMDEALARERKELTGHHDEMQKAYASGFSLAFILAAFAMLFFIGVNSFIARSLLLRMHRLRLRIDRVAAGNLFAGAADNSSDELGSLSRAFSDMTDKLRDAEMARAAAEQELRVERDLLQQRVADATDDLKRKAEALERALGREMEVCEMQRQFIVTASHEFRTPLAIISSVAQRLNKRRHDVTPEEMAGRLGKIAGAVGRMSELIDSTLSAERIDAGDFALDLDDCNLGEMIADLVAQQLDMDAEQPIECDLEALPARLRGDRQMLEQIISNLLSNAVKYSPERKTIRVRGWREGDAAVVSVMDQGIGISDDELSRIFQRFYRARTAAGIAGTGIGLSLVKRLVKEHGGSISVESAAGKGSAFTVRLPIAGPPGATGSGREAA